MATQLFPRAGAIAGEDVSTGAHLGTDNTKIAGGASAWSSRPLAATRGSGVQAGQGSTVSGPTAGIEVGSGSRPFEFLSLPIAADVTISGTVTCNVWAGESSMNANVAINVLIERVDPTGQIASTILKTTRTTELGTSRTAQNFTGTPTSTDMTKGDRIRVRVFGDDAGTMGSGFTFTMGYSGGSAGADGDTYVTFTENISFISAEPTGSTLHLTNVAGPAVGAAVEQEMWTGFGSGVVTAERNTAAGWTAPLQWTDTAGGTAVEWYSRPLTAFTLSGPVGVSVWAHQSNIDANASVRAELAVCDGDGSNVSVWSAATILDTDAIGSGGAGTDSDGALTTTTAQVRTYLLGPDASIADGQRLRLRLYVDDSAANPLTASRTATLRYSHTTTGSGDSVITLGQTVTEFSGSHILAAGTAAETDTAIAITKSKRRTLGATSTTDTAIAVAHKKVRAVGVASETDVAVAVTRAKVRAVGVAAETDSAGLVLVTRLVGTTSETDTAGSITTSKQRSVGVALETDAAQAFARTKTSLIGAASETDTAGAVSHARSRAVGATSETDTAVAITRKKRGAITAATETDSAQTLARVKSLRLIPNPRVASVSSGSGLTGADLTTPTINYPSGTVAGDLILMVVAMSTASIVAGQTVSGQDTASGLFLTPFLSGPTLPTTDPAVGVFARLATATGGSASFSVTGGGSNQAYSVLMMRIVDHGITSLTDINAVLGTVMQGSTTADPDPPAVTPAQGAGRYLVLAGFAGATSGALSSPYLPSGYGNVGSVNGTSNLIAVGQRVVDISTSEDPGTMPQATIQSAANIVYPFTIAIVGGSPWSAETDTALPITRKKTAAIGVATETDGAEPIGIVQEGGGQTIAVGAAVEADEAGTIVAFKTVAVSGTTETDTAEAISRSKTVAIGVAAEADSAELIVGSKARTAGVVTETDSAQTVAHTLARLLGIASESDAAVQIAKTRSIGVADESDSAFPISVSTASTLGVADESDTAEAIAAVKVRAVGSATESDTAGSFSRIKARLLGIAAEIDVAGTLTRIKVRALGSANETDAAQPVVGGKRIAVGTASEADTAQQVGRRKTRLIGIVTEVDSSQPIGQAGAIGAASETDAAGTFTRTKTRMIGAAVETDTAGTVGHLRSLLIGIASEIDIAGTLARIKTRLLGTVTEADTARPVTRAVSVAVGPAAETDTAEPLSRSKTLAIGAAIDISSTPGGGQAHVIGQPSETDTAGPITLVVGQTIGVAVEIDTTSTITSSKRLTVGPGFETDVAVKIIYQQGAATPIANMELHLAWGDATFEVISGDVDLDVVRGDVTFDVTGGDVGLHVGSPGLTFGFD